MVIGSWSPNVAPADPPESKKVKSVPYTLPTPSYTLVSIGASGARILVTLLAALQERGLERGIAALCIGGGEATALAIERLS